MTTVQITISDAHAKEAAAEGLLETGSIEAILRERLAAARIAKMQVTRQKLLGDHVPASAGERAADADEDAEPQDERPASARGLREARRTPTTGHEADVAEASGAAFPHSSTSESSSSADESSSAVRTNSKNFSLPR